MPNTLIHFAAQGAASHGLWRRLDPRWIFLGCLLPDVPWILRRAVVGFGLPVDTFDLRLYTMAQASLAFTLLLCAALAVLTAAPRLVFLVLGANALFHLLLDATEVKWGNGVHLAAPLSWRMTSFDLVVGESPVYLALTILGALLVAGEIARRRRPTIAFDLRPARLAVAGALLKVIALAAAAASALAKLDPASIAPKIGLGGLNASIDLSKKGRASGGPVRAGEAYVVGEKRPELFVPNRSGRIVPRVPAGFGSGGQVTVQVNAPVYGVNDLQSAIAVGVRDGFRRLTAQRRFAS